MSQPSEDRGMANDATQEAALAAQLAALTQSAPAAETLLSQLASALFPDGAPGLELVTWAESASSRRVGPDAEPPDEPERARLRSAEVRYRTLIEQIPAVTFMAVLGEGQNEIYVSPHIEAMLGFRQKEWLEDPFLWYWQLHPDDRQLWNDEFARGCRTGGPFRAECRFLARDGRVVWVRGEARLVKDDQGRPLFLQGVAFDITESKRAHAIVVREAVQTTEDRYRDLVEGLGAAVWEAEPVPFKFTFMSRRVEQILGFPPARWINEPDFWRGCIHPEDRETLATAWRTAIAEGVEHTFEYRAVAADGHVVWLHDNVRVVRSEGGWAQQLLGVMLDVTARRRAEDERARLYQMAEAARRTAEEANRAKDQFLATMSHELRTPLSSVLGWARMLRGTALDAEQTQRALASIERNARSQLQLIEDILDVSRIITGKLHLSIGPVDLVAVTEAAVDTVRFAADAKGIALTSALDQSAAAITGDAERLQQVVWNLLSNAIKFTPSGGHVRVRLERSESGMRMIVSDTGSGISPEFLPYVFDRFQQADSSSTRRHGGLGLGLAIVRHLVELHGGKVRADSPGPDQGSTFTVDLPVTTPDAPTPKGALMPDPQPSLTGLRALLVEDDEDAREVMTAMLRAAGAVVTAVSSAAEALEALDDAQPDVLVSDVGMPGDDGYALIGKVRARGSRVPAIAVTAYARKQDRARALRAGFQAHVSKPVDPLELAAIVAALVAGASPKERA